MPFKEATFWWGTIVGGTGIYFWVQGGERMTAGIILTIVGLLMSAYAVISHYKPQLPKLSMWVAGMVLTLAVLGYDIYDRHQVDSIPEFDAPQNQFRAGFGVVIDKCNITVNGQYLLAYKEKFEIAPACFVADGSVGLLDTPFFQVGTPREITESALPMSFVMSETGLKLALAQHQMINLVILLIPKDVRVEQIKSFRQARLMGVKIKLVGANAG